MVVGINSNLAASSATANLGKANSVVSDSISRLSSGNRIIKASDDAAGLAIGTSLQTTVTSLEIALLNTEQARSVLQIADGALSQVGDILTRQKALATQSNSGSISDTERGYINQEFTALTSEIDRIVTNTNFNGITLLNGSVAGDASVSVASPAATTTNTTATAATVDTTAPAAGDYTTVGTIVSSGGLSTAPDGLTITGFDEPTIGTSGFGTITAINFAENGAVGESVQFQTTINGNVYQSNVLAAAATGGNLADNTTITFTAVGTSTSNFSIDLANAYAGAIDDTTSADTVAAELTTALAPLSIYQQRDADITVPGTGDTLDGVVAGDVVITSDQFNTTADTLGEIGEFTVTAGSGADNSISVVIDGRTFNASNIESGDDVLTTGDTITLYGRDALGDLNNESVVITLTALTTGDLDLTDATDAAALEAGLNDLFGVVAAGTTTTSAYSTVGAVDGTNVTAVSVTSFDDPTYQTEGFGTISASEFTENGTDAENVTFTATLGDKTYTSALSASANGGGFSAQALTFTATDGSGSAFDVTIAASGTIGDIDDSTAADTVAAAITTSLADVDIYQTRTISSVDVTQVTNTVLEGITATSATLTSNAFDATASTFGDVGSFEATAGSDTANQLSVQINGTTFSATDLGGSDDVLSSADSAITLIGRDAVGNDNGQRFTLDISSLSGSIDLTNQDELNALTDALDAYVGVGTAGSGGLSFQVGSTVTDKIDISISSAATSDLYVDDSGVAQTLSVATQSGAQSAIDVLDNAIGNVVSKRADIGASISRFNFAASNIEVSIANQDNARGSFLDADIANESTVFATEQVKLQAAVSVLSQANQLPKDLLRLLQ